MEPYRPGFDIIFLDIEMPTLGGMPTAERIRMLDPDVILIFVTNMAQYAIRGYEVDAMDFVLKPVSYYQFSTKLERAFVAHPPPRRADSPCRWAAGCSYWTPMTFCIWKPANVCCTTTPPIIAWSVRGSLLKAEKELAPYHFARCNQCYLSQSAPRPRRAG